MSLNFKSVLDDVGNLFKKIFTSKVATEVNAVVTTAAQGIVAAAPVISLIPGFGAMIEAGANIALQVEGAAASAGEQTGTGAQKLAIALPTVEQIISNYAQSLGMSIKSAASASTITNAIVSILNEFGPAAQPVATTPVASTVATAEVVSPVQAAVPAVAAPSTQHP